MKAIFTLSIKCIKCAIALCLKKPPNPNVYTLIKSNYLLLKNASHPSELSVSYHLSAGAVRVGFEILRELPNCDMET